MVVKYRCQIDHASPQYLPILICLIIPRSLLTCGYYLTNISVTKDSGLRIALMMHKKPTRQRPNSIMRKCWPWSLIPIPHDCWWCGGRRRSEVPPWTMDYLIPLDHGHPDFPDHRPPYPTYLNLHLWKHYLPSYYVRCCFKKNEEQLFDWTKYLLVGLGRRDWLGMLQLLWMDKSIYGRGWVGLVGNVTATVNVPWGDFRVFLLKMQESMGFLMQPDSDEIEVIKVNTWNRNKGFIIRDPVPGWEVVDYLL